MAFSMRPLGLNGMMTYRSHTHGLFVTFNCAPTDWILDTINNEPHQQILRTASQTYTVVLTRYLIARVWCLVANGHWLGVDIDHLVRENGGTSNTVLTFSIFRDYKLWVHRQSSSRFAISSGVRQWRFILRFLFNFHLLYLFRTIFNGAAK